MPFGTSYITKTIRLHPVENRAFDQAGEALGGLERAQLIQEAVLFEAFRLGIYYTAHAPPPLRRPWPYLPDRSDEPTEVRVSISMRVTVAELMSRAAEFVGASEPLFIIGATMAYVGRLQACYEGTHAASPESARDTRTALRRIKVPEQYRYRAAR
jgi:hypothetical protein